MLFNRKLCSVTTLWVLAITLLTGCTTTPGSSQNNDENLLGQNISMLYQQWGEPDYRSNTSGEEQQLHIWDINGCQNNVTAGPDGTITGYAVTGECDY